MNENNQNREYAIEIDPRILELLGPSLYTNIYYILAELIANSYDAGAKNVYIIQNENSIIVEDDGYGMSYENGDIEKYLSVAKETRLNEKQAIVRGTNRRKMGRKGVGKLAALSVSKDVWIMSRKNNDVSGFILSRNVGKDHKLKALKNDQIQFQKIGNKDGTSVVMTNPQYDLHKTVKNIKKNLLKIFPLVDSDFRIHILTEKASVVIDDFNKSIIGEIGSLITLGDKFSMLSEFFNTTLEKNEEIKSSLLKNKKSISIPVVMKNKKGEENEYILEINGWIGTYRTTRGRKSDKDDFPDNFISILSNGKMGEYNILPSVGKNLLSEVYVVGQLHVDLLEQTDLPDMALSNRQGYKTDDIRYKTLIDYVSSELLPEVIKLRNKFAAYQKNEKEKGRREKELENEEKLKKTVSIYKKRASKSASNKIKESLKKGKSPDFEAVIAEEMNEAASLLGIKKIVDDQKKKILISHASEDKDLSDIICKMLVFNNVPDQDILYTSSYDPKHKVPEDEGILSYLRNFFVKSMSTEKIYVIYVTSQDMIKKWHPVLEVGAMWITKSDHKIFNKKKKFYEEGEKAHKLQAPLDIQKEWHTSIIDENNNINMTEIEFKMFTQKIKKICDDLGYKSKSIELNDAELERFVN